MYCVESGDSLVLRFELIELVQRARATSYEREGKKKTRDGAREKKARGGIRGQIHMCDFSCQLCVS